MRVHCANQCVQVRTLFECVRVQCSFGREHRTLEALHVSNIRSNWVKLDLEVAAVTTTTPWILESMKFTVKACGTSSLLLKSSKPELLEGLAHGQVRVLADFD